MNTQKKTLIIVSTLFIIMIALIGAASRMIALESFSRLEERNIQLDVRRARSGISDVIESMKTTAVDWAFWSDTYDFVLDGNADYIETNMEDAAVSVLKVNFMLYINLSGEVIYAKFLDWEKKKEIAEPENLLKTLLAVPQLLIRTDKDSGAAGIVLTRQFPLLTVSKPILKSDFTGPARGTLIIGRFLNSSEIRTIGKLTHLKLDIRPYDAPDLPDDYRNALTRIKQGIDVPVFQLNPSAAAGYAVQNDISGKPAFILKVEESREIFQLGQKTVFYHIVSMLIIGLFFILLILISLQRTVLSPLRQLNAEVNKIRQIDDLSIRVAVSRTDEFGNFAGTINRMLEHLAKNASELQQRNKELELEIKERQTAENALRESEERFRAIFRNAGIGIGVTDLKGKFVQTNPALQQMLGYTAAELSRKTFKEITHPDDREMNVLLWQDIIGNKRAFYRMEKRYFRCDGSLIWVNVIVSLIKDALGNIEYSIGLVENITEKKKTELELKLAKEAAETSNRAKSEFLANMSHEIRTPMNSVLGFLQLSLESPDLPKSQRKNLSTAYNSAKSLLSLLNDILDLSKLESGKLELEEVAFDMEKLIRDTLSTFEFKVKEKGLSLSCDIHPDLLKYYIGDPVRLRQILINLIGNAVKFTEKGGIVLSADPADEPEMVHFSVEDTGIGIPPDRLDKIFEPFTQADSSTSRRFGGTGLGTTISKQLAELMGGNIRVQSTEGKGTAFRFTVRMKAAGGRAQVAGGRFQGAGGRAQAPVFPEREGDGVSCFRILLAEDVEENILLAKIRMEQHGHTVIEARDGFEAVHAYEREAPDIILMDVHMPGMDGIEAVRQIRELESASGRRVPVIALTASVMKEDQLMYLKSGMDAVVGKPIDFEELFSVVEKLVAGGRVQAAGRRPQVSGRRPQDANHPASGIRQPTTHNPQPTTHIQHPAARFKGIDIEEGLQMWQDKDVYQKALTMFCREYEHAADLLGNLIKNGDRDGAYRLAHTLKGVAGNLSVTEVFCIVSSLNAEIREKPADELIPMIESLGAALNQAADSIRRLVSEPKAGVGEQEIRNSEEIRRLFKDLLASFEKYNPTAAEPFLEKLDSSLSLQQTDPIRQKLDRFDFDGAKTETGKLAEVLGIHL